MDRNLDFIMKCWLYLTVPRCWMPQMLTSASSFKWFCILSVVGVRISFYKLSWPVEPGSNISDSNLICYWSGMAHRAGGEELQPHAISRQIHDYSRVGWERVPVVNAFRKGTAVNCLCCNETTGILSACLCPQIVSQKKNVRSDGPLWHARPCTSLHTTEVIT